MSKPNRVLYLGLDPTRWTTEGDLTHLPLIRIVPRPFSEVQEAFAEMSFYTHVLFTSRATIPIFQDYAEQIGAKTFLCLGKATAEALSDVGLQVHHIAKEPSAEGVVTLLEKLSLKGAYLFFPHSALARELIPNYLKKRGIKYRDLSLYTTAPNTILLPDLNEFDEIVFTSPSTVKAFRSLCHSLPPIDKCRAIGPITKKTLKKLWKHS